MIELVIRERPRRRRHRRPRRGRPTSAIEDGRIVAVGDVPEARARSSTPPGRSSRPGSSTSTATRTTRCSSIRARSSAVHQGVTLEVVGNCGFGCFPIREQGARARRRSTGTRTTVPLSWTTAAGYFERLEEAAAGGQRAQPRARTGSSGSRSSGLADRPATAGRARADAIPARRGARARAPGATRPASSTQPRAGATEDELAAPVRGAAARRHGIYATHTRRRDEGADEAVDEAIRTARALRACGCRSRTSFRGTGSRRRGAASSSSTRPPRPGIDVAFDMHTRALRHDLPLRRAAALGARGPGAGSRELLRDPASARRACAELREHPQRRRRLESRSSCSTTPFWPEYARRDIAVDRRRARPGAARRGLRPARSELPTTRAS